MTAPGCGDTYVGETKQCLRTRVKQHCCQSSNRNSELGCLNTSSWSRQSTHCPVFKCCIKNGGLSDESMSPFGREQNNQQLTRREGYASSYHAHETRSLEIFPAVLSGKISADAWWSTLVLDDATWQKWVGISFLPQSHQVDAVSSFQVLCKLLSFTVENSWRN